jgi:hypothetical protein
MKRLGAVAFFSIILLAACGGGSGGTTTTSTTPTGVATSCGNQRITVSWSAVSGATSYNVYRANTPGTAGTLVASGVSATSYADVFAGTVGNSYYYTVKAVTSSGTSAASAEVAETFCRVMGGATQGKQFASNISNASVSTPVGSSGHSGAPVSPGVGSLARFSSPQGMTTDGTYLYVADYVNNVIQRIDPATQTATVFAGSGASTSVNGTGSAASFFRPYDITNDGTNLYVTEFNGCNIRKIVIATAVVTTLAGTGTCVSPSVDGTGAGASFDSPQGITTDGTYLYVTENTVVRRIDISSQVVIKFAGDTAGNTGHVDAAGNAARFNNLEGITTDGTALYVLDQYYNDIRKIDFAGNVTTYAGDYTAVTAGSTDGTGTGAKFNKPFGISSDGTNLYVVEQYGDVVRKIDIVSAVVTTLAGAPNTTVPGNSGISGTTDGVGAAARFSAPQGITVHCGMLFIGDTGNSSIRRIQ